MGAEPLWGANPAAATPAPRGPAELELTGALHAGAAPCHPQPTERPRHGHQLRSTLQTEVVSPLQQPRTASARSGFRPGPPTSLPMAAQRSARRSRVAARLTPPSMPPPPPPPLLAAPLPQPWRAANRIAAHAAYHPWTGATHWPPRRRARCRPARGAMVVAAGRPVERLTHLGSAAVASAGPCG